MLSSRSAATECRLRVVFAHFVSTATKSQSNYLICCSAPGSSRPIADLRHHPIRFRASRRVQWELREEETTIDIQELAAWGEFLGGIAVIGGLVFVGFQLRMANRESKLAANDSYLEQISSLGLMLTEAEFAELFQRGSEGLQNLDSTERLRYLSFCSNGMFRLFENLYIQHSLGRLESRVWEGVERTLTATASAPGVKEAWQLRRDWYSEDFRDYFDAASAASPEASELLSSWRSSNS